MFMLLRVTLKQDKKYIEPSNQVFPPLRVKTIGGVTVATTEGGGRLWLGVSKINPHRLHLSWKRRSTLEMETVGATRGGTLAGSAAPQSALWAAGSS